MSKESVEEFLNRLKLGQYTSNLIMNGITDTSLIKNEEVLKLAGIEKPGHRKRILTDLNVGLDPSCNESRQDDSLADVQKSPSPESPPPLPPKGRQASSKVVGIGYKPIKPIRRGDSLPYGFKPDFDNYKSMPPVPPRRDLGECEPSTSLYPSSSFSHTSNSSLTSQEELPVKTPIQSNGQSTNSTPRTTSPDTLHPIPAPRRSKTVSKSTEVSLPKVANIIESNNDDPPALPQEQTPPDSTQEQMPLALPQEQMPLALPQEQMPLALPQEQMLLALPQEQMLPHESQHQHNENLASEDEHSDPDIFVSGDELDVPDDQKSLTISMKTDKGAYQKFLQESTLNRQSQKADNRKSRFIASGKSGYLNKRGGQHADKSVQKRYIEFNGVDLRYFKERGGDAKQIIPVSRMTDVVVEVSAKKPTFHLITPNRKFTFIEPSGKQDEMTIWVSVLMEAILSKSDVDACDIGGSMADPDKEGWLQKQGHGIKTFKPRYVVIKGDKLSYYRNFEDYKDAMPISCLEMLLASLRNDETARNRFKLTMASDRDYIFEADSEESYNSWRKAIELSIQIAHADQTFFERIQENKTNRNCADCGDRKPVWASVNLCAVVCAECIGCHRMLGQKTSKARSILMDEKIWTDPLVKLFQTIGNENANKLWEYKMPSDDQIRSDCPRDKREEFIKAKYDEKRYFRWSEMYGQPEELGVALRNVVVTDDVVETLRLIVSGADVYYVPKGNEDKRTPYELAKDADRPLQMALLLQYQGHLTEEERLQMQKEQAQQQEALLLAEAAHQYEKTGLLMMRLNEKENWRESKTFMLKGRKIEYKKTAKPEDNTMEYIDLAQVEELSKVDKENFSFMLRMASKSYYLKAFTPEDAESWYQVIRHKQVVGVPLEKQDVGADHLPHLLHKCIEYMERNALTETKTLTQTGIYRLNGGQVMIKRLVMLFNQDAAKVRLDIEEYHDVHAIAGLLKLYLRELPEPLLTDGYRQRFVANTSEHIEHNEKLFTYRDLLKSLPEINYSCLRVIVLHLNLVTQLSDINKMTVDNIVLIFGPIVASCVKTTDQPTLNKEYAVLTDLLTYYQWMFEVTETEMKNQQAIIDFIRARNQPENTQQPSNPSIDSMQIPLFFKDTEDLMKMDSTTKPYDVCLYTIKKYMLEVTTEWALFEVTNSNCFERPVYSKEKVLDLALTLSTRGKLVVKENYLSKIMASHSNAALGLQGYLFYSTRGDRWKKNYYVDIKHGNIIVCSKKDSKEEENIGIHEVLLYIGVVEKKSPGKFGFMLKLKNSAHKEGECRYFCSDNEYEVYMFITAILLIRYPTGIWTERQSKDLAQDEDESKRYSQFWGRQSVVIQPRGTSIRLIEQLQKTRGTLRRKIVK